MKKLLLQLDSSRLASVFDRVVAYDAGADEVLSYGGIVPPDVRDLIYGLIFTRGPRDLAHSAVFIGGADINVGDAILTAAQEVFFGAFRVSLMLDSNGSNTTAVAAVVKIIELVGSSGKSFDDAVQRATAAIAQGRPGQQWKTPPAGALPPWTRAQGSAREAATR